MLQARFVCLLVSHTRTHTNRWQSQKTGNIYRQWLLRSIRGAVKSIILIGGRVWWREEREDESAL